MTSINYDAKMQEQINALNNRPKLLLHSCCAVCSTSVLERLIQYFDVTVYYYNPNIYPKQEYDKRLFEQKRYANIVNVKVIEAEYNDKDFYSAVKGLETAPEGGARCFKCISLRMQKAAKYAKENGFDYFTTTLSVSPHKNAEFINCEGERLGREIGISYLYADFKKREGFKRSGEIAKEYNIYRQNYCGCEFSYKKD